LGTPDSPEPKEVGKYLREFLMDPLVIDIPALARWILVNILIVPRRAKSSSALYKKVWTSQGSPLLFHTKSLAEKLNASLGGKMSVQFAMRYGNPSISKAIENFRKEGITKLTVVPLYPQYSTAASESSIREVKKQASGMDLKFIPPFYNEEAFLNSVTKVSEPFLAKKNYDAVLFSFHGLPERQIVKCDKSTQHCLNAANCCEQAPELSPDCYRRQSFDTAKALAKKLNLSPQKWFIGFQSRLGGTPWIQPYSDEWYRTLPAKGVRKLAVLCPSFVADCLETLEEVQMRGKEEFVYHGGEELDLIPCVNSEAVWVEGLKRIIESAS
jgi:ferrochelatase